MGNNGYECSKCGKIVDTDVRDTLFRAPELQCKCGLAKAVTVVVVFSGGQDSTTCLFWALNQPGWRVFPLTINYGQKHVREVAASKRVLDIARRDYMVGPQEVVNIGSCLKGASPLVNEVEVLEQYKDHDSLPGGLEKTFVPMRNQLFLTLAANRAACLGARGLVTGVCEADSGGYPDCRQDFIDALQLACNRGTFTGEPGAPLPLVIHTPLMRLSKASSVKLALEYPGCYEALAHTHTAYDGVYPPVSHDHANLLRAKGFIQADVPDPLVLRAWKENLMDLPLTPNYRRDHLDKWLALARLA